MNSAITHIRALAIDSLQINIWPTKNGFQANVKERVGRGWTCVTDSDPIVALAEALRQRVTGASGRTVICDDDLMDLVG